MKIEWFLAILLIFTTSVLSAQKKMLIITGGHDFEEKEFFGLFDSFEHLTYDWLVQPKGNEMIQSPAIEQYEAIVFYDMYQEITDAQKAVYLHALDKGLGMVIPHHLGETTNGAYFLKI